MTLVLLERGSATVVFQNEPVTYTTFNRFLREVRVSAGAGGANFVPMLQTVDSIVKGLMKTVATVSFVVVTDGVPSDDIARGASGVSHLEKLVNSTAIVPLCTSLGQNYGERLTVALHVYSEQREDRLVIDTMRDEVSSRERSGREVKGARERVRRQGRERSEREDRRASDASAR